MAFNFDNILKVFGIVIQDAAQIGEATAPIIGLFDAPLGTIIKSVSDRVLSSSTGTVSASDVEEIVSIAVMGYSAGTGKTPDPAALAALKSALSAHAPEVAAFFAGASNVQAMILAAFPRVVPSA